MALVLPNSIFIHIPKTGGTWIRLGLRQYGFPINLEIGGHNHTYPAQFDAKGKYQFAFVRHPLSWYESYWNYKQHVAPAGWDMNNPVDKNTKAPKFHRFIEKMIEHYPGFVSYSYRLYTQIDTKWEINFIGRQENLREDLVKALLEAGETFDEEKLRAFPEKNVSPKHPEWEPKLREKIIQLEEYAFKRFGYEP